MVTDGGPCFLQASREEMQTTCEFLQDSTCFRLKEPWSSRGKTKPEDWLPNHAIYFSTVSVCSIITQTGSSALFFKKKIAFCKGNECSPTTPDLKGTPCIFYMHLLSTVTFIFKLGSDSRVWNVEMNCLALPFPGGEDPDRNAMMLKCINGRHCARRWTAWP